MTRAASIVAAALLLATACRLPSPVSAMPETVLAVDDARAAAMIDADADALGRLLDDDLTYAHSNGRVDSKSTLTAAIVSGRVDYRAIVTGRRQARAAAGAWIVTGPVRIEVVAAGRSHRVEGAYTAVYRRDGARWCLVAYHSSSTP